MPYIQIGSRLMTVAQLIGYSPSVIDVGSDHAKLPAWLLLNGKTQKAFACDISPFSAQKAKNLALQLELSGRLIARCCNGLSGFLSDDAEAIILAGMGGETIANILSKAPWIFDGKHRIAIQCMSSLDKLNEFLSEHHAHIIDETAVIDMGRLYSCAVLDFPLNYNGTSILPSLHILKNEIGKKYIERLLRIANDKLKGIKNSIVLDETKLTAIQNEIDYYNSLLNSYRPKSE